jgi:CDP-glucose 4,6-dehydratase
VVVTTDKVYEQDGSGSAHAEHDRLGGRDPYSASKACAELAAAAYRASFFDGGDGPAVATARAGNVIGGGDWGEDRLVPDLMRAVVTGTPALIRNPDAVRPWQHVLNPLSGYLALAEVLWRSPEHAGPWNFGPDEQDARPVRWIVERLSALWGEEIPWRRDGAPAPHESPSLRLDSTNAREQLGWTPRWDLDAALAAVVAWHRGALDGDDPRELVMAQIDDFSAGVGASIPTPP